MAGTNKEGYHHALRRAWEASGLKPSDTPSKSSLSEARSKVSYEFFEDTFRSSFDSAPRKKFRGYDVYAVDGDQLDLPASEDVLAHNFRGYPSKKNQETHYPKAYVVHVLDVVNNLVADFAYSAEQEESSLAQMLVQRYGEKSIFIYDRLHCGFDTFVAHEAAGNYFVVRARTNGGGTHREVKRFIASPSRSKLIKWEYIWPNRFKPAATVRLVKVRHPKTKEDRIYVTNLPSVLFSNSDIERLYRRRWDIETSFKDLTDTLKLNQWHSTKINGVLQEVYALLWLANSVRTEMNRVAGTPDVFAEEYEKSNFKLCTRLVIDHLKLLVEGHCHKFRRLFRYWACRMIEKRRRFSRSNPREVKHRGREYPPANAIKRRERPVLRRQTERY